MGKTLLAFIFILLIALSCTTPTITVNNEQYDTIPLKLLAREYEAETDAVRKAELYFQLRDEASLIPADKLPEEVKRALRGEQQCE